MAADFMGGNLYLSGAGTTMKRTSMCIYRAWSEFSLLDTSNLQSSDHSLRKYTYSKVLKIIQSKKEKFQIKLSDIFHISAQNIDCGYLLEPPHRGGSNEYPQSMF